MFSPPRGGSPHEFSVWPGYAVALAVGWIGWGVSYALYYKRGLAGDQALSGRVRRVLENKFYVDEFYGWLIVRPLWAFARALWRIVDAKLIDGLLVGMAEFVEWCAKMARRIQNGDVQRYAAVTALGVAALVYLLLVRGS